MPFSVSSTQSTLRDLFAPGAQLAMPPYQRSYSWGEKEATDLLGDLVDAASEDDAHFIGAIVLVDRLNKPTEIVDGQQRLTTLTILLAVLRDLETDAALGDDLHAMICDAPSGEAGEDRCWRLTLNHVDGAYFRAAIQERGATRKALEEPGESDSQRRLARNVAVYRRELEAMNAIERRALAEAILLRCSLVLVFVDDRDAGYKVFRVLNTRGKEPNSHDIIKTDLFERAGFDVREAEHFSRQWAEHEARLGGSAFDDLLRQIRSIYDKSARGDIVRGFQRVVGAPAEIRKFMAETLPAYVEAYRQISKGRVDMGAQSARVNDFLNRLRALDHHIWRAPALKYLVHRRKKLGDAVAFFQHLERFGFAMQLIVHDRDQRMKRYRRILDAVESDRQLYSRTGPFALNREEHTKIFDRLRGRFATFGQRRALALRLNAALDGGATVPPEADATVEHVLPRNPEPGSYWLTVWPNALVRKELCDTIGNFVLLPHIVNQQADRLTYQEKKKIYFNGSGDAHFALTEDLIGQESWTPKTVRERTERLADILCDEWGIQPPR